MNEYGFMLIDKPKGFTSFDVIRKIRKITGIKKIGHSGTLDPFATGLLILCIGKATKLCSFLLSETKEYIAKVKLGIKTDTGDTEGKITKEDSIPQISKDDIKKTSEKMLQLTRHIPPAYSAKKIDGVRAYKLARGNKKIDLQPTPIKIYSFEILKVEKNEITYKTRVSKGTYIRVLSEIFASYINSIGTTVQLRRTKISNIDLKEAISLSEINQTNFKDLITPVEKLLTDYQKIFLTDEELLYFKNGRFIKKEIEDNSKVMICNKTGTCIGFAMVENNLIKPKIVLI